MTFQSFPIGFFFFFLFPWYFLFVQMSLFLLSFLFFSMVFSSSLITSNTIGIKSLFLVNPAWLPQGQFLSICQFFFSFLFLLMIHSFLFLYISNNFFGWQLAIWILQHNNFSSQILPTSWGFQVVLFEGYNIISKFSSHFCRGSIPCDL